MKRFLFLLVSLAIILGAPVLEAQIGPVSNEAPVGWPGVYPIEFLGGIVPAQIDGLVSPTLMCNHPWGMVGDDGDCAYWPYNVGHVGYPATFTPDRMVVWGDGAAEYSDVLTISIGGMMTNGRQFGTPPAGYSPERTFVFDPNCGCYMQAELEGGLLRFEAWVYRADGSGLWVHGCLESTGSFGPWWAVSDRCVYSELEIGPMPDWNTARGARRVGRE